jgi:hypothetical protein
MVDPKNNGLGHPPRVAPAPVVHGSSVLLHWLLGIVLFLIAVGSIVGVVVTMRMGEPTVAIIIALFAAAFFSRVAC